MSINFCSNCFEIESDSTPGFVTGHLSICKNCEGTLDLKAHEIGRHSKLREEEYVVGRHKASSTFPRIVYLDLNKRRKSGVEVETCESSTLDSAQLSPCTFGPDLWPESGFPKVSLRRILKSDPWLTSANDATRKRPYTSEFYNTKQLSRLLAQFCEDDNSPNESDPENMF